MTENPEDKLRIPRIIFQNHSELQEYFNRDNVEVLTDILEGIQQGYDLELTDVDIFEVEIKSVRSIMLFSLILEDWNTELGHLLDQFVAMEEYELASITKELIGKVTTRLKSKTKNNV